MLRAGLDAAVYAFRRLHIERPGQVTSRACRPIKALASDQDAWIVPFGKETSFGRVAPKPQERTSSAGFRRYRPGSVLFAFDDITAQREK